MQPVPDGYLDRLAGSHVIESRVESWLGSTFLGEVDHVKWAVRWDMAANVAGTLDLTAPPHMVPTSSNSPLEAHGQRLKVWRNLVRATGQVDEVLVGTFWIQDWDQSDDGEEVSVKASSVEQLIIDADMESAVSVSGRSTLTVVQSLLNSIAPAVEVVIDGRLAALDGACPVLVIDQNPLEAIRQILAGINAQLVSDPHGRVSIEPIPLIGEPVMDIHASYTSRVESFDVPLVTGYPLHYDSEIFYDTGVDYDSDIYSVTSTISSAGSQDHHGNLITRARGGSRDGVVNAVTARGESVDDQPAVQATAIDNDPTSPTYWYGNFGRKRGKFFSPVLTTTAMCLKAAQTQLAVRKLFERKAQVTTTVNPALRFGDTVRILVHNENGRIVEESLHVLETIGFDSDTDSVMNLSTKSDKAGYVDS